VNYIAICLTKFMTLLLVCSHWAGCGFFYLASQLDFNEHTWVGNVALPEGLLKDEPWTTQYVYSVYWAVTTLTTVGYGDISPEGIAERVRSSLALTLTLTQPSLTQPPSLSTTHEYGIHFGRCSRCW